MADMLHNTFFDLLFLKENHFILIETYVIQFQTIKAIFQVFHLRMDFCLLLKEYLSQKHGLIVIVVYWHIIWTLHACLWKDIW